MDHRTDEIQQVHCGYFINGGDICHPTKVFMIFY